MSDVRLYMFDGGSVYLPLRNFNLGQGGAGEMITTPVIWFLITHPRGNVIIDGGNAAEVAVDAKAHWGAITEMSTPIMTPEQAVVPALEAVGIDLASIRWIVQSHLHLDHTGAVAAIDRFPNAQVLVTRTEYEWAHAPESFAALGYCKADYVKPGIDWVILEDAEDGYDLFGDGTLVAGARLATRPATSRSRSNSERRDVRPDRGRGEHDRPPGGAGVSRLHHLDGRHRPLGTEAAATRLAGTGDRGRRPRP